MDPEKPKSMSSKPEDDSTYNASCALEGADASWSFACGTRAGWNDVPFEIMVQIAHEFGFERARKDAVSQLKHTTLDMTFGAINKLARRAHLENIKNNHVFFKLRLGAMDLPIFSSIRTQGDFHNDIISYLACPVATTLYMMANDIQLSPDGFQLALVTMEAFPDSEYDGPFDTAIFVANDVKLLLLVSALNCCSERFSRLTITHTGKTKNAGKRITQTLTDIGNTLLGWQDVYIQPKCAQTAESEQIVGWIKRESDKIEGREVSAMQLSYLRRIQNLIAEGLPFSTLLNPTAETFFHFQRNIMTLPGILIKQHTFYRTIIFLGLSDRMLCSRSRKENYQPYHNFVKGIAVRPLITSFVSASCRAKQSLKNFDFLLSGLDLFEGYFRELQARAQLELALARGCVAHGTPFYQYFRCDEREDVFDYQLGTWVYAVVYRSHLERAIDFCLAIRHAAFRFLLESPAKHSMDQEMISRWLSDFQNMAMKIQIAGVVDAKKKATHRSILSEPMTGLSKYGFLYTAPTGTN